MALGERRLVLGGVLSAQRHKADTAVTLVRPGVTETTRNDVGGNAARERNAYRFAGHLEDAARALGARRQSLFHGYPTEQGAHQGCEPSPPRAGDGERCDSLLNQHYRLVRHLVQ